MNIILRIIFFAFFIMSSCTQRENNYTPQFEKKQLTNSEKKVITFAIHPLYNPEKMSEVFGPLIKLLNTEIKEYTFQLESSKDYASYEEKIKNKSVDIILPNPYQTLIALNNNYQVFAKMGDDLGFKGIILVRKDSKIEKIKDLKNKTISFPAPTALAAAMMPIYYLNKNNLAIHKDYKPKYLGSQESSVLAALHKETDAAVTWPQPLVDMKKNNPLIEKDMKIIYETPHLISNSLMFQKGLVPLDIIEKFKKILVSLNDTGAGVEILKKINVSEFQIANDDSYKIVEDFIQNFNKEIKMEIDNK